MVCIILTILANYLSKLTKINKVWTAFTKKGHDTMYTNRNELIKNGLKRAFKVAPLPKHRPHAMVTKLLLKGI